jgi:hypothetical protein
MFIASGGAPIFCSAADVVTIAPRIATSIAATITATHVPMQAWLFDRNRLRLMHFSTAIHSEMSMAIGARAHRE